MDGEWRQRPLEPPENSEVRDTLDERRNWKWLRGLIFNAATWIAAVAAAVVIVRGYLIDAAMWIIGLSGGH